MTSVECLREFFKTCSICLLEEFKNDCGRCIIDGVAVEHGQYYRRRGPGVPFQPQLKWTFEKSGRFSGYVIVSDDGREIYGETFSGGPFCIPYAGGSIVIDLRSITFGPYTVLQLFNEKKEGVSHVEESTGQECRISILAGFDEAHVEDAEGHRREECRQSITLKKA